MSCADCGYIGWGLFSAAGMGGAAALGMVANEPGGGSRQGEWVWMAVLPCKCLAGTHCRGQPCPAVGQHPAACCLRATHTVSVTAACACSLITGEPVPAGTKLLALSSAALLRWGLFLSGRLPCCRKMVDCQHAICTEQMDFFLKPGAAVALSTREVVVIGASNPIHLGMTGSLVDLPCEFVVCV